MLKLSQKSYGAAANGMIVNFLSNDLNRFDLVALYMNYFWIVPIQVVIVSFLIWREIDLPAFAGVSMMVFCTVPMQGKI